MKENWIKWQATSMTRYGKAGPPIQHSDSKITLDELKTLIAENDILPNKIFSKEEILSDPLVAARIEALREIDKEKEEKRAKEEEDDMIPDDNPSGGSKKDDNNPFIPDSNENRDKGENELIPD